MYFFTNPDIGNYCHNSASPEIIKRGYRYFTQNRVTIDFHDPNDPNFKTFHVVGSNKNYTVIISVYDGGNFVCSCNCPFDWDGICKHQIAAMIHLDYHSKIPNNPNQPKTEPKIISIDELFDRFMLKEGELSRRFDDEFNGYTLRINKLLKESIDCEVGCNIFYRDNRSHQITIANRPGGLEIKCSCSEKTDKYCSHLQYALYSLMELNYFPDAIVPSQKERIAGEVARNIGLHGKISTKNLVDFKLNPYGNILLEIDPAYQGILPVEQGLRKKYRDRFMNTNLFEHEIPIDLPELTTDEQTRTDNFAIGHLIIHGKDPEVFEIAPLAAKMNKAGNALISNYCYYDELCMLPVSETENDEFLIKQCNKINSEQLNRYSLSKKAISNQFPELLASREKCHRLFQYLPAITEQLAKHPHVFHMNHVTRHDLRPTFKRGDIMSVKVSENRAQLFFQLRTDDLLTILEPLIQIEDETFPINSKAISFCSYLFVKKGTTLYLINGEQQAIRLLMALYNETTIKISKDKTDILIEEFVVPLSEQFEIRCGHLYNYDMKELRLKPIKRKLYISGEGNFVLFKPLVEYSNNIELEILKRGTPISLNGYTITKALRDLAFEEEYENFIKSLHPVFNKQFPYEFFNIKADQMIDNFWFFDAFHKLQEAGVEVFGLNELKNFRFNTNKASINTNLRMGKDWFEANVDIAFGDNKVSLTEVRKAILKHEKFIKLSDGTIGILPQEWLDKFSRYLRLGEIKNNKIQISKTKFAIIDILFEEISDAKVLTELATKREKIKAFQEIKKVKIPEGITAELRPYQKEGFNWLNFLDEFNWGGILADDMGLGKTLQAICFLKQVSHKQKNPSLVVLPTTLIFNWENELKKFCPSLKTLFHYGTDRAKETAHFDEYELIITTYGLIINDIGYLKDFKFNYILLDESQAIKNPASKRYKAVKLLKANNRIAMTGTPIENGTFDLYAQMSFVNPGMFGSTQHFRDDFALPIDRDGSKERATELQKLITPFVLRRTKEQVAKELPPKTEDMIYCTMDNDQRKVYDAYRNEIRNQLLNKIETDGLEKSKIHILEGLMKLRQICDSPALLSNEEDYGSESVKIQELIKHITQKTSNHKIVIFSQFVKMLTLIKLEIGKLALDYEYLDGQCTQKQRKESVERFQQDESCRLFLISLKAGGTGINLTAADYVYIVDPWWNPAVENQAIDRCYRIGQDKKVFAYRMICKDTIEDKIMEYQKEKRSVAESIIQTDEHYMKQISGNDVMNLFA